MAVLILLATEETVRGQEKVLLTVQPRIPIPSLGYAELPAGMLDGSGNFAGAASREIAEETGITIKEAELLDLTAMTGQPAHKGIYMSPGRV